jgi:predicted Zn-dependent protease with MMP-like domain
MKPSPEAFERIAAEEFNRIPERFARRIANCALLIAEEPDEETRREEGLGPEETLLGLYRGVPATERGDFYSGVLPDTITLFRLPLEDEAEALLGEGKARDEESALRLAVRETLWHEIGHHFGMSEAEVHAREEDGTNEFEP